MSLNTETRQAGGIVLCGGHSKRMGWPKAILPFGPELMLQRVVRLLDSLVKPIVVVAAADQEVPELPDGVMVARDRRESRGPLEGLYAGLLALQPHADRAYATSCDVPLLHPKFVTRMIELAGDYDVAVPIEGKFHHPMAAVYSTSLSSNVKQLLDSDRLRPVFLFEEVRTRRVEIDELRQVDPGLESLMNLNTPSDYLAALRVAGFEPTEDVLLRLNQKSD